LQARIRGSDPESDLAVLKAEGSNLPAITFAAPEALQVGDVVLAIGNPFGFGSTVTLGIVSALGRNQLGINRFEDFIQTDAAINPGNSGGALVDAEDIWSASTARSIRRRGLDGHRLCDPGLARTNGAHPDHQGRRSDPRLARHRAPGDHARDRRGSRAQPRRRRVDSGVQQNGPADRAGVLPRDVVLEIGGRPTPDVPHCSRESRSSRRARARRSSCGARANRRAGRDSGRGRSRKRRTRAC
jgi:serine protease DegQ